MNDIFEKNSVTLILLKIFDIYLCHYFAIEPQTTCQLIAKDKVGEQHILRKYCNCNSFGVTMDLLNCRISK